MADPIVSPTNAVAATYEEPLAAAFNQASQIQHDVETTPLRNALTTIGNPSSNGEDRVKASEVIKNYKGADEPRWPDIIRSMMSLNVGDAIIAATGGADRRVEAYDAEGNRYFKVYNQRGTAENPNGELRRYEDAQGRPLSEEQMKGKVIASVRDIPLNQRAIFTRENISAQQAATAMAQKWNADQLIGAAAAANAPTIEDSANTLHDLLVNQGGMKFSVNPATRSLVAGMSALGTGSAQELSKANETLSSAQKGTLSNKGWEDFKKQSGGLKLGLQYEEGKGLTNTKGDQASSEDISKATQAIQKSMRSNTQIQARRDDLLNKASILAAEGKLENLDLFKKILNENYKIQTAISAIEQTGGIGIARPNPEFQTGDSFSALAAMNEGNRYYGKLARLYADHISKGQQEYQGSSPPIGEVQNRVRTHPEVQRIRSERNARLQEIETLAQPIREQINKQSVSPELLVQPGVTSAVPEAVPPKPQAKPAAKPKAKRSLSDLAKQFGG